MKKYYLFIAITVLLASCADKKEDTSHNKIVKETSKKDKDLSSYVEKGKEIAMNTQKLLGKNLKMTMKSKGPVAAVEFCNLKAAPLAGEMEKKYNATIKRVSNKYRNENNKPNAVEANTIAYFETAMREGKELKPMTTTGEDGKIHFYAPIKVKELCLTCHGDALAKPVDSILKIKYPNDKATGYKEGELRGIWSIIMEK